jgi:hypothetical protein
MVTLVPVGDIAALHVGALLLPSVKSQRLFASAYAYNWNEILAILRKDYPDKSFYDDVEGLDPAYQIYDDSAALKVLRELGQDGWTPFEVALEQNVKSFA